MPRAASTLVCILFLALPAQAQSTQLDRARLLLNAGNAIAALDILEALPETPGVLRGRAQAHMLIAFRSSSALRCDHLRRATAYASMASDPTLLEYLRKMNRDEGCPLAAPVL